MLYTLLQLLLLTYTHIVCGPIVRKGLTQGSSKKGIKNDNSIHIIPVKLVEPNIHGFLLPSFFDPNLSLNKPYINLRIKGVKIMEKRERKSRRINRTKLI